MKINIIKLLVVLLGLFHSSQIFAETLEHNFSTQNCPGWVDVSLQWTGKVKEFCYQYGQDCRAVSMMYEPPINEMYLDPLYGDYDENTLINPENSVMLAKLDRTQLLQARKINCGSYVPTAEQLKEKETNQKLKDECFAKKGHWDRIQGRGHLTGCTMPTKDEGKECHGRPGECEGLCVDFKCYGWKDYRGCGVINLDGKNMCID